MAEHPPIHACLTLSAPSWDEAGEHVLPGHAVRMWRWQAVLLLLLLEVALLVSHCSVLEPTTMALRADEGLLVQASPRLSLPAATTTEMPAAAEARPHGFASHPLQLVWSQGMASPAAWALQRSRAGQGAPGTARRSPTRSSTASFSDAARGPPRDMVTTADWMLLLIL